MYMVVFSQGSEGRKTKSTSIKIPSFYFFRMVYRLQASFEIKTHLEIISTAIWGMERAGKRTRSINGHDALKKQIETEEANSRDVEMVAWLAVVRK
jgi:hypothetical protein